VKPVAVRHGTAKLNGGKLHVPCSCPRLSHAAPTAKRPVSPYTELFWTEKAFYFDLVGSKMDNTPTALFESYEADFKHMLESVKEKLENAGTGG
jgi:hypothetical protein